MVEVMGVQVAEVEVKAEVPYVCVCVRALVHVCP